MSEQNLKPINPLEIITEHAPLPQRVLDSSAWFKTETVELDFGEYQGRPNENALMHTQLISQYLSSGWYVDAVVGRNSNGRWTSVSETQNEGQSSSSSEKTSHTSGRESGSSDVHESGSESGSSSSVSSGSSDAGSRSHSHSDSQSDSYVIITGGHNSASGHSSGNASGSSSGHSSGSTTGTSSSKSNKDSSSSKNGSTKSDTKDTSIGSENTSSTSTTTNDGPPYWFAAIKVRMKRRKIFSELVLKDMVKDFTDAFNEGRKINIDRYDELVSLYAIMLNRTESEANTFSASMDDFAPLIDMVRNHLTNIGREPDEWLDKYEKNRVDEINRKFESLLGQSKSQMISNGTYNGTVWPSVEAGIRRDWEIALDDLIETISDKRIDTKSKVVNTILDSERKILDAIKDRKLQPTELRNNVFKWMLDFMERRNDQYPSLDRIGAIAEQVGYSEGGHGGYMK